MNSAKNKLERTVRYYDGQAEDWAGKHGGYENESYWKTEMEKFHQLMPHGRIIEIGSGAGKDACALIKMGYDYTGTDASSGLLSVAQRRNPEATFVNAAVHDLQFPENSFDGFWTAATLLHLPKTDVDSALQLINKIVKHNGIGFISMKQGSGEKEDVETGRWFSYYQLDEFGEKLTQNGFEIVENNTRKGEKDIWLVYFVRKT